MTKVHSIDCLSREGECICGPEWTIYIYAFEKAYQRICDAECDRGLLLAPARPCHKCNGSGYIVVWIRLDE